MSRQNAGDTILAKDIIMNQHTIKLTAVAENAPVANVWSDVPAIVVASGTTLRIQWLGAGKWESYNMTGAWTDADAISSVVILGSYVYVFLKDAGPNPDEFRVYRFAKQNLAGGGTQCTFSGSVTLATSNSALTMSSDGTYLFFNFKAGNTANDFDIAKYSISGTTLTYVSFTALGAAANVCTHFAVRTNGDYIALNSGLTILRRYNSSGTLQTTGEAYGTSNALVYTCDLFVHLGFEIGSGSYFLIMVEIPE